MYTWSGSQRATRLFSSLGWRADKKPCAGARSWLYLPGAEGWRTPDESHRQLHQERADRMCTNCHREGRPDRSHFLPSSTVPIAPLSLRLLYSISNAVNHSEKGRLGLLYEPVFYCALCAVSGGKRASVQCCHSSFIRLNRVCVEH